MHSVINIKLQILLSIGQELLKLSLEILKENKKKWKFLNSKVKEVLDSVCIMLMKVSKTLPIVALNLPFKDNIHSIWPLKIPSLRNMMVDSKISSKESIIKLIKLISKAKKYGTNTDWLMIWLPIWLNLMVDMFGPVKTMMVMFKVTVLLKVIYIFISRLWIIGINDISLTCSRWISWIWSCSRNSYQTL